MMMERTSFTHRLNTSGGKAPAANGAVAGQVKCHSQGSSRRPTCAQSSVTSPAPASAASVAEPLVPQIADSETMPATAKAPVIYAVDDDPGLTELYRIVLNGAG